MSDDHAADGLPLGPIDVNEHNWLYVERDGLLVVHQVRDTRDGFIQTDQFRIPWPLLRLALAYRDKKKRPRRKSVAA